MAETDYLQLPPVANYIVVWGGQCDTVWHTATQSYLTVLLTDKDIDF